ncbi:MAG: ribonuclease P protein component [Verrucomicrobiota bacterium]|nr:ribonuclease P protein component [Verrucomicrobiota bacterium]
MPRQLRFPKSKRLTRAAEFERVRKEGRIIRGSFVSIGVLSGAETIRAGFITSRRVGGAVLRNRVRRRLREIVRHHQDEIVDGTWIVTIASSRAAGARYAAIEAEWLRLAKRASILAP